MEEIKKGESKSPWIDGILEDPKSKRNLLIVAALATFLSAFTTTSVTVALPTIASQFNVDVIFQTWIVTIFLVAVAIFTVPFGKLSGKIGLKKFLLIGVLGIALSCIGASLSPTAEILMIFRAIQGICSAMISVSSMALVAQAMPPQERGKALGMNIASVYIGLTIGPVVGGAITQYFSWQGIFLVVVPFAIINLLLSHFTIEKEWKMGVEDKFDYLGTILYAVGILFTIYGFTTINDFTGAILTVIGIIILIAFVICELKQKTPVFEVKLFKHSKFSSSTSAALISYLATFLVTTLLSYYLQYIKGMDPQTSGLFLIITPALMAIVAPISGRFSDKIDPQKLSALGMALVAVSLGILAMINKNTDISIILIAMFIEGIGIGLFTTPNTNTIMSTVERKFTSIASATVATARVIGQTLSMGMVLIIFAIIMGSVVITPNVHNQLITSIQIAFSISTIFCIIAIILSFIGISSKDKLNRDK